MSYSFRRSNSKFSEEQIRRYLFGFPYFYVLMDWTVIEHTERLNKVAFTLDRAFLEWLAAREANTQCSVETLMGYRTSHNPNNW